MTTPTPIRSWPHVVLDRLVIGLLAFELLLLLLEQLQLQPLDRHKGWPVLIAVASVAFAAALGLLWFIVALFFRLPFQFGLRSLILLVVAVAIPCSWFATERLAARKAEAAARRVIKLGGIVVRDYECEAALFRDRAITLWLSKAEPSVPLKPRTPVWLLEALGEDFFSRVAIVDLRDAPKPDLSMLIDLPETQELHVSIWGEDGDLQPIENLRRLECLDLSGALVTDDGLKHLRNLRRLLRLGLANTLITEAGLENLQTLDELEGLDLSGDFIKDAGVECLVGLTTLRELSLWGTRVTAEGRARLQQALPNCKIEGGPKR